MIRLAVDAMSGDRGPVVACEATVRALHKNKALAIELVGQKNVLKKALGAHLTTLGQRLHLVQASQIVTMDEAPTKALRHKKDASMRIALERVRDGVADGCVSAGNTGALTAMASYLLPALQAVDRPAIVAPIPAVSGQTLMLDLGANSSASPEQLLQFAAMGSVMAQSVYSIDKPRVGLLNIGSEEMKGSDLIRAAGRLLETTQLNYVGFVEGNDIFNGSVDVVVCDGFVGNVALKTSEGLGRLVGYYIRQAFNKNFLTRLMGIMAKPALSSFYKAIDARRYNGATFVGLENVVVKSHGNADVLAFEQAICHAFDEVDKKIPEHIAQALPKYLASY